MHGPTVLRVCVAVVGACRGRRCLVGDLPLRDEGVSVAARRRQRRGVARDDRPSPSDRRRTRPLTARRADRTPSSTALDEPARHRTRRRSHGRARRRCPTSNARSVAYHYLGGLPYAEVASIIGGTAEAARRAAADGIANAPALHRRCNQSDHRKEHSMTTESRSHRSTARALIVDPDHLDRLHADSRQRPTTEGVLDVAYRTVDSPVGSLLLAATDTGLVRVAYANEDHDRVLQTLSDRISPRILHHPTRLDATARELDEYFAGRRRAFSVRPRLATVGRLPRDGAAAPRGHRLRPHRQLRDRRPACGSSQGVPRRRYSMRHEPAARRRALPPCRQIRRQHGRVPRRHPRPKRRSSNSRQRHDTDAQPRSRRSLGVSTNSTGTEPSAPSTRSASPRPAPFSTSDECRAPQRALRPTTSGSARPSTWPATASGRGSTATSRTRCQRPWPNCERRSGRTCSRSLGTGRPGSNSPPRGPTTSMRGSRNATRQARPDRRR